MKCRPIEDEGLVDTGKSFLDKLVHCGFCGANDRKNTQLDLFNCITAPLFCKKLWTERRKLSRFWTVTAEIEGLSWSDNPAWLQFYLLKLQKLQNGLHIKNWATIRYGKNISAYRCLLFNNCEVASFADLQGIYTNLFQKSFYIYLYSKV